MDFHFCPTIKWSDINPLNHAIRNEYIGNLMNLTFAVVRKLVNKKGLKVTNGFICSKLVDSIQKDQELKEYVKSGKCIGFTFDEYSADSFVQLAKELKALGIGSYLTSTGFYSVLGGTEIKIQNGNKWNVIDR